MTVARSADGIFVMYNFYREDWLLEKLAGMLTAAFGSPPIVRSYGDSPGGDWAATLAAGPAVAALGDASPPGDGVDALDLADAPRAATDDWPFLYLREPHIAPYYLGAIAIIIALAVLLVARAAVRSGTSIRRFSPHFFVLGIAFLLLETRSLVAFSLLFGTTWLVKSLVFFAVLASVLLAILINQRFHFRSPALLYVGLFGSLALAFVLPPAWQLLEPAWLRYALAAALAFAPVFFANLVFSYSFRDTRTADMAFASNLLGAVVGGAVEYVALVTGYGLLLAIIALLYLAGGCSRPGSACWPTWISRQPLGHDDAASCAPRSTSRRASVVPPLVVRPVDAADPDQDPERDQRLCPPRESAAGSRHPGEGGGEWDRVLRVPVADLEPPAAVAEVRVDHLQDEGDPRRHGPRVVERHARPGGPAPAPGARPSGDPGGAGKHAEEEGPPPAGELHDPGEDQDRRDEVAGIPEPAALDREQEGC
jgi:hypothetical protein